MEKGIAINGLKPVGSVRRSARCCCSFWIGSVTVCRGDRTTDAFGYLSIGLICLSVQALNPLGLRT